MPSSISLQGLRIYRPGVYGIVDASALGGAGISTGNVAIVGGFPTIEQNEPLTFTSARAVRDFDPDDLDLQLYAKAAFSPAADDRIAGGAQTLTVVNAQTTAQASYPGAKDSTGADSLILQSKLWGPKGNRTFVSLAENPSDATGLDFTIARGSVTETFTNLQSGTVADFYFTGAELDDVTFAANPSALTWTWKKEHVYAGAPATESALTSLICQAGTASGSLSWPDAESATCYIDLVDGGTPLAVGETVTVTVSGVNSLGVAVTGATAVITYAEFNGDPNVKKILQAAATNVAWSSIEEVTFASTQAGWDGTIRLYGVAFDLDTSDYNTLGDIVAFIDQNSNKGWNAKAIHPRIGTIDADQFDVAAGSPYNASGSANKVSARADLWAIVLGLGSSALVTPTRAAAATRRPGPASLVGFAEQGYMVGGSLSALTTGDFDAAFTAIENSDIQIVVPTSTDIVVGSKLRQHCVDSALAGYERNGYFGVPIGTSLANTYATYSSVLNSRHVAVVGQEVQVENARGALEYASPTVLAVMLAGMQAGSAVATPLTWKRPRVFALRGAWDPNADAAEAIQKGIITLSTDSLGIRVERSVTSYLQDDNPVYSEVSANESINTSIRDLRAALQIRIGDAVYGTTANKLKGVVEARLNAQVLAGTIKAWQNASLTDGGDSIAIEYEVAAVEPLNFITLTANVVRIASEV